jgi:hypothetical protein
MDQPAARVTPDRQALLVSRAIDKCLRSSTSFERSATVDCRADPVNQADAVNAHAADKLGLELVAVGKRDSTASRLHG